MAILKNGPFGNMSGKVGNVVIYTMKDKMVMRSMPSKRKSKAKGKEKASQELFKQVMLVVKQCRNFVRVGFAGQGGHSPYHQALSTNIKRMVAAGGFDYREFLFSTGNLAGAVEVKAELTGNELIVSWEDSTPDKPGNLDDTAMLLVINKTRQMSDYNILAGKRENNISSMTLEGVQPGDHLEVFLSFIARMKWIKDSNPVSDSTWVGSLVYPG